MAKFGSGIRVRKQMGSTRVACQQLNIYIQTNMVSGPRENWNVESKFFLLPRHKNLVI